MTREAKPEVVFGEFTAFDANVSKVGFGVPVTNEMLEDAGFTGGTLHMPPMTTTFSLSDSVVEAMRYRAEPWTRPDRNPFPHMDPTPRMTRLLGQAHGAAQRMSDAWYVLRNGIPERDDW